MRNILKISQLKHDIPMVRQCQSSAIMKSKKREIIRKSNLNELKALF